MATFHEIAVGDTFDWINERRMGFNSFFLACQKVSTRCYVDTTGQRHEVGTVNAQVFHVGAFTDRFAALK